MSARTSALKNFIKTANVGDRITVREGRSIETYTLTALPTRSGNTTVAETQVFDVCHNKNRKAYEARLHPVGERNLQLYHGSNKEYLGTQFNFHLGKGKSTYQDALEAKRFSERKFLEYWEEAWYKQFPDEELPQVFGSDDQ